VLSVERNDDQNIWIFTKGICFFGTPQSWTRQAWQIAIQSVIKAAADRNDDGKSEIDVDLQSDGGGIWRDTRYFQRFINERSIRVLNVIETNRTPTNKGKVMVKPLFHFGYRLLIQLGITLSSSTTSFYPRRNLLKKGKPCHTGKIFEQRRS